MAKPSSMDLREQAMARLAAGETTVGHILARERRSCMLWNELHTKDIASQSLS